MSLFYRAVGQFFNRSVGAPAHVSRGKENPKDSAAACELCRLCIHDLLLDHPRVVTSNVVYVRFHGAGAKYAGSYSRRQLLKWALWMNEQARGGRNVYAYFNNDAEAHAVRNAQTLRRLIAAEAQRYHG